MSSPCRVLTAGFAGVLLSIGLVVSLCAVEVAVRVAGSVVKPTTWTDRPYAFFLPSDSHSLQDADPHPKAPGVFRVAVVGDSFTFGTGVDDDETWEAVLASGLVARGAPVEILNAGVPGYGFDQVFRAAQSWSAKLRPDLVLVGLHCTDLASDWDVPLWDLREGRPVPLDPSRNWIALQARLRDATPAPLRGLRTWRELVGAL